MRQKIKIYNLEEIKNLHKSGVSIRKLSIIYNISYTSLRRELLKVKKRSALKKYLK
jgi:lambda repressor-like predicted transcriptional regulator